MADGQPPNVISFPVEIEGQRGASQFRYSRDGFRLNMIIALGLTALTCGLVWLLLGIYGSSHMNFYTALAGLAFFAFISARMLAQYFKNDIVLAVQPTGLYDSRISSQTIPWGNIKELLLLRREQSFSLKITLWPVDGKASAKSHEIELSVLEGGSEQILEAINAYMPIRLER